MPPVLFTRSARLDLTDYGILIPLKGSRPDRIREALTARFGPPEEGGWGRAVDAQRLSPEDLRRVHTPRYVELLASADPAPAIEVCYELIDAEGRPHRYAPETATRPLAQLVERHLVEASGTLSAMEEALAAGFCHFLGGGMHHALADGGRGFCLIHDVLIGLRRLQAEGRVRRAWVVDTDCHKGDGTAALTLGDPTVSTLSIHMAAGWPLDSAPFDGEGHLEPWFWPSTVDRGVPRGGEAHYLPLLASGLDELERVSPLPDLAVVVGGSDPFEGDVLPSADGLKLSLDAMFERDRLVYIFLAERGIPQAWVLAGGYGDEVWRVHARFLAWVLGGEG